jgi:multidrug efflux pump subunit AcrA (membrane-fusion protein)
VKKKTSIALILLSILSLTIATAGCGSAESTPVQTQTTTVTRGDISLDIMASGNLALSTIEDLVVDLSPLYPTGTKGTIGEVLVAQGDTVAQGQVLVTLDKSEWADQLTLLEDAITNKERALVQAQINLKTAEQSLENAQDMTSKNIAIMNAEISLETAQNNLANSINAIDVDAAYAALNKAKRYYDHVANYMINYLSQEDWELAMLDAQEKLDIAQINYDNALAGYTDEAITLKKKQVEIAEYNLTAAKKALDDAQVDITLKQMNLTLVQGNLNDAEETLEEAKNTLAEAQQKSPEILAPFDGFITMVNVAGGDEVLTGTVVAKIADPNKFKASILVSEMDILGVTLGVEGTVMADAIEDVSFPVKVTFISPTATISSSVVNYAVTVEVTSLIPVDTTEITVPTVSDNFTFPSDFTPPTNFTPPADFTPPTNFTPSENFTFRSRQGNTQESGTPQAPVTEKEYTLKEGMTVTVTLVIPLSTNVLLVPSSTIKTQGNYSYIVVMLDDGTTENRIITTGNTDYTNTEVTSGLTEGEKVVVSSTTIKTTATATVNTNQRNDDIRIFEGGPLGP